MPTVDVDHTAIYYEDVPGPSGAPAILWGQGFLMSTPLYAHLLALLPGYRHVIPDTRGHGRSAAGTAVPTLTRMADDLWAVATAAGLESFFYVGHSMGGANGVRLAARHPGVVRAGVSIAGIPVTGKLDETRADVGSLIGLAGDADALAAALAGLFVHTAPDDPLVAECGRSGALVPREVIVPITATEFYRDDSAELLPHLTQPWLFLVPTLDGTEPEHHQVSQAQLLPDATVVRLEGEGHMVPQERPEALAGPLRDFLARHGG
ncbi:alpha/beta hydrolase [Pseudonocardia zijingensis]|uniref:Alpha/beta hydrolase n=1 Tax=Pseudonocardia zijingensis TaxID=153376 RepID=A0ABN1QSU0_9PSEU